MVSEPSLQAWCYTRAAHSQSRRTFVLSGATEAEDAGGHLDAKTGSVLVELDQRLALLGTGWADATEVVLYTAHDAGRVIREIILPHVGSAALRGISWQQAWPPVRGFEVEIDCRGLAGESFI